MKLILIGLALSLSAKASDFKMFYVDDSGSKYETADALMRSVKGESIYKCQSVEAKVSKSGSSIGMKNVKKPKVSK